MPSTSKSKGQKSMVKQQKSNWSELPYDVMANILHRVGAFDILENVEKVCTSWRKICMDPVMWRVIHFHYPYHRYPLRGRLNELLRQMCKHAVDRSQGQLVDITIVGNRYVSLYCNWTEALKKLPLLEELVIYVTDISKEAIETAGRYCPMLKTLKLNETPLRSELFRKLPNETSIAIGENLPELRHLELIGDTMKNIGLEVILDRCRHLESLDLRACFSIDLKGDTGKRCLEKIKCLKLPHDSLEGCPYRDYLHDYDQCIRFMCGVLAYSVDDDLPKQERLKKILASLTVAR